MTQERKKLVELKNVSLTFNKGKSNEVEAIDDVSFDIYEGEIFGLVGESGSGKTTIGRSVLKLSVLIRVLLPFQVMRYQV